MQMGFDRNLLMAFLAFWSTTVNAFILPSSVFSQTLLDVATIPGQPSSTVDTPSLFNNKNRKQFSMHINKRLASYYNFVDANMTGSAEIFEDEHGAFLFYWLCKYLLCSSSFDVVFEYQHYIGHLFYNRPISLASLVHSLIYRGLNHLVAALAIEEDASFIAAPLWVLQLWLFQYFPEFGVNRLSVKAADKAEEVAGYRLRSVTINQQSNR